MNVSLGLVQNPPFQRAQRVWVESASLCLCVYMCVSHLAVEQPVKSMNEYTGSIFHFFIWSPHSGHVVFVSGQQQ